MGYLIYGNNMEKITVKNKIILVGGYCATGKSTFSHELSKILNIPCFNKDIIKEVMGEGFGYEYKNVLDKQGSICAFLFMLYIAEQFLLKGEVCILESNFKQKEAEQIETLLEKYNCKCLTYIFKGEFETLYSRYTNREKSGKRHWIHITEEENFDVFKNGHKQYGLGEISIGETIVTDATTFNNVNYDSLHEIGKKFILN